MKIFRLSGLIGFVVFSAILAVIGFFFLDNWVKKGIEVSATRLNAAEVNVGDVDVTLSPIGFKIFNLQVTDKDKPTHNSFVMDEAVLDVNLAQLFLGKVRINDIRVEGIASDVERASPGELVEQQESGDSALSEASSTLIDSRKESLSNAFASPQTVVEESSAASKAAIANAEQVLSSSKVAVDAAVDQLPDDDQFSDYEQKIAELESLELDSLEELIAARSQIQTLGTQLTTDKLAIERLKKEISNSVNNADQAVAEIKSAPAQDLQTLLSNNPFNKETALKVSSLLLGEEVVSSFEKYKGYYDTAKPWLERLSRLRGDDNDEPEQERLDGQFIRFAEPNPTPEFLIDNGSISFIADNWPWFVAMADVTGQQDVTGKPITFEIQRGDGEQTAMQLDLTVDRRLGETIDTLVLNGQGVEFSPYSANIADSELTWVPQPADLSGQVVVDDGEVDGRIRLSFTDNNFTVSGTSKTDVFIQSALSEVTSFDIFINVSGSAVLPSISISSTLDDQLGDAFNALAQEQYDAWVASVEAQLQAQVEQLREPIDNELDNLKNAQQDAELQAKEFEQKVVQALARLENKVEDEIQQIEDEAKAKVKAAEDAAKKEAEDKAKSELEKLKNSISF